MDNPQADLGIEVGVVGLSSKGDGVGKVLFQGNELTCFIAGACPGDRVLAQIVHVEGPIAEARLVRIIASGTHRVLPPCRYVPSCGGCSIQHVAYAQQLVEKQALAHRALSGVIPGISQIIRQIIPARAAFGTRTRGRFHVSTKDGSKVLGLHQAQSSSVVDIESCMALDPILDKALQWVRKYWLDEFPDGAQVNVVVDEVKSRALVAVSIPGDSINSGADLVELPEEQPPGWLSIQVGERKEGAGFFPLNGDRPLRYAPEVFTQSDVIQNRVLVQEVLLAAHPSAQDTVLDLYCGVGNLSLPLAKRSRRVEGVDGSRRSIEIAKANAKKWDCRNAEFFKGDMIHALKGIEKKGKRFDVVILDPPRVGVGKEIELLERIAKKRIVYISCNPKSLAKDIALLRSFKPVLVQPIDMFPQTMHVETVVALEPAQVGGRED